AVELTTRYDSEEGGSNTDLSLDYGLYSDLNNDPLARFGNDRELMFGLGYLQMLALIGENAHLDMTGIVEYANMLPGAQQLYMEDEDIEDGLNWLQPEDFLGLQLYQADDAGNGLYELYGLFLISAQAHPFELKRSYQQCKFNPSVPPALNANYTDSYHIFPFQVMHKSKVQISLVDASGVNRSEIISEGILTAGPHMFLLEYGMVADRGITGEFTVELIAVAQDGSSRQTVIYPGRLTVTRPGKMLGQTLVHDVLIQDGSLNLSRRDLSLNGRGPQLAFSRSYHMQGPEGVDSLLGPGWSHSLDKKLYPIASEEYNGSAVPEWVAELRGKYFRPSEIPEQGDWTFVRVNGTAFQINGGQWYAERGRHGELTEAGGQFIYTAKDGTKYFYDYPSRTPGSDGTPQLDPTHMSIGDGLITRLGLASSYLSLSAFVYEAGTRAGRAAPSSLQKIVDKNNNELTLNYDTDDKLTTAVDAVGRSFNFEYEEITFSGRPGEFIEPKPRLTRVTGPVNLILELEYDDDNGLLIQVRRGERVESYGYEEVDLLKGTWSLTSTKDSNNNSYNYEYYSEGEPGCDIAAFIDGLKPEYAVKKVIYPDSHYTLFSYNQSDGNKRTVTDLRNNPTVYTLNETGNPVNILAPMGKVTGMTWSIDEGLDDNVMTSRTDSRNHTTSYEYDGKGNITRETDHNGHSIITGWNQQFSLPESRTDRNNVLQTWSYEAHGNLDLYVDGDGKETGYSYFPTGERMTMTDPRGYVTHYTYDDYGLPATVHGPEGSHTEYTYNIRGLLEEMTDPNNHNTVYTYDNLDYPQEISHPDILAYNLPGGSGRTESFDYDAEGNLLSETDLNGLSLTYTYTDRDQVETISRSMGGQKHFSYDANGNLEIESDWKGQETLHEYNALNQRNDTTNRLGHSMAMTYDLEGNLTSVTDYENNVTTYEYDALNRITDIYEPALDGQDPGHIVKTYYDESDPKTNLATQTDQENNTTGYEYNGRYLLVKRTNARSRDYLWEYDDSGNLVKETDEEGNFTSYSYDKQNRRLQKIQM
ncbi:MAG: RHS repeat protein, partial [Planctomycetes bacterium]|nr:RHS repeat protein [Planctomycetota bacterium]